MFGNEKTASPYPRCDPPCFVAMVGNEVIGYLLCNGKLVALLERYHRKGIGRQLFHHCLNSLRHVRVSTPLWDSKQFPNIISV